MIEGVGLGVVGWREVIMVPGGLCWAGDHLTMTNRKALFSFPVFFLFLHRRPRSQGHSFTYTTCILSCSIFNIGNVDGMYFKIQMRAPCT